MNAIRITWPTGHAEARADVRSNDPAEKALARQQSRAMKAVLGLKG